MIVFALVTGIIVTGPVPVTSVCETSLERTKLYHFVTEAKTNFCALLILKIPDFPLYINLALLSQRELTVFFGKKRAKFVG